MKLFIPHPDSLQIAQCLNSRHLDNQIKQCKVILDATNNTKSSQWHPVVKLYMPYTNWLKAHLQTLLSYRNGAYTDARRWSVQARSLAPHFVTTQLCAKHQRHLYTLSPNHYNVFSHQGVSNDQKRCATVSQIGPSTPNTH